MVANKDSISASHTVVIQLNVQKKLTLSVTGVGSVMRLADRPPPAVVMRVFSRSYLSNGRAIGMVVVRRLSVIRRSRMNCG